MVPEFDSARSSETGNITPGITLLHPHPSADGCHALEDRRQFGDAIFPPSWRHRLRRPATRNWLATTRGDAPRRWRLSDRWVASAVPGVKCWRAGASRSPASRTTCQNIMFRDPHSFAREIAFRHIACRTASLLRRHARFHAASLAGSVGPNWARATLTPRRLCQSLKEASPPCAGKAYYLNWHAELLHRCS